MSTLIRKEAVGNMKNMSQFFCGFPLPRGDGRAEAALTGRRLYRFAGSVSLQKSMLQSQSSIRPPVLTGGRMFCILGQMVSSLLEHKALSPQQIQELSRLLEQAEQEAGPHA